ncbi:hypothetical protein B296_00057344 [Ensete ventricosum]|uniref:Uncharacterized protein n=1 Tax=Ensete ventricosum TaxID=4639 RepID=A0A426XN03_ENSVE|nr:hypothetical protein B296_00057344 [Ensete ventricosum]
MGAHRDFAGGRPRVRRRSAEVQTILWELTENSLEVCQEVCRLFTGKFVGSSPTSCRELTRSSPEGCWELVGSSPKGIGSTLEVYWKDARSLSGVC